MGEGGGWQLLELLASDFWRVRRTAAEALGVLTEWREADGDLVSSAASRLALLIFEAHPHPSVREEVVATAAEALGKFHEKAEPHLLQLAMLLRDDESARVRTSAVQSLSRVTAAVARRRTSQRNLFDQLAMKAGKHADADEVAMPLAELLYIVCRVLVSTLRDQGLRMGAERTAEEFREGSEGFQGRSPRLVEVHECGREGLKRSACYSPSKSDSTAQGGTLEPAQVGVRGQLEPCHRIPDQMRMLHLALEDTFSHLGTHVLECLCRYLLGETGGRLNRMAAMRGLHCTGGLDVRLQCAFLVEWALGRLSVSGGSISEHGRPTTLPMPKWPDAEASLPLRGHKVVRASTSPDHHSCWAVLKSGESAASIVFASSPLCTFSMAEPDRAKSLCLDVSYPRNDSGPIQVHDGLWAILEEEWADIVDALVEIAGKSATLHKLVICGNGPSGGLALLATIKLLIHPAPLGSVMLSAASNISERTLHADSIKWEHGCRELPAAAADLPCGGPFGKRDSSRSQDGEGVTTITFGAPNVIGRDSLGELGHLQPALRARCNPRCRSFRFEQGPAHQSSSGGGRLSWAWQMLCCNRRSTSDPLRSQSRPATGPPSPESFGPLFGEELLTFRASGQLDQAEAHLSFAYSYTCSMIHRFLLALNDQQGMNDLSGERTDSLRE